MEISRLTVFLIFLITTAVVTICVFNSIIYYEIFNNEEPDPTISYNTAKIYFGINIGVGAITFMLWLWSIYKMIPKSKISPILNY
jgi:hypothetical protein